jgi:superfamily I DNA/RNA helicase
MTVHKSKGLEDDNVALYGKFPIKPTKDTDEYKVFYVGITRARTKCIIFV